MPVLRELTERIYDLVCGYGENPAKASKQSFCRQPPRDSSLTRSSVTEAFHAASLASASTALLTLMLFKTWSKPMNASYTAKTALRRKRTTFSSSWRNAALTSTFSGLNCVRIVES